MTRRFKAVADDPQPVVEGSGIISMYVSTFGVVDTVGDMCVKGTFTDTLKRWRASGKKVPVMWQHGWDDPTTALLGYCDPADITEDNVGLKFGRVVLDMQNPSAALIYRAVKAGTHLECSFAYDDVTESRGTDGANILLSVELIEGTICVKGANPDAGRIEVVDEKARVMAQVLDLEEFIVKSTTRCAGCGSFRETPVHGEAMPACPRCATLSNLADIETFLTDADAE